MSQKYLLVLSSPLKNSVPALLKEYSGNIKFDTAYLSSEPKEKILKGDVSLNFDTFKDYDIVCPVGAEALKYVCGLTGITKYNGSVVNEKFIPILDPNMVFIKPQYADDLKKAFSKIQSIVKGEQPLLHNKTYHHYTDELEFLPYLKKLKDASVISVDTETSSLSPRQGNILGFVFSTAPHEGVYVEAEVVEYYYDEFAEIFRNKKCVFHNAKFDIQFISYEFGFEFPDFEDTMLLHYCLDESVGSHGLKQLAMKFTDLGDYEKELDDYKKTWCRQHKIKLENFNYGMLPTEILAPYACLTHDSMVIMADGSKKTIGELVRSKSTELVRSFNHKTNEWENKPISGWHKLKDEKVSWFKIATSITSRNSRWDTYNGPVFTPDHRIATSNGYKEVQNINIEKDKILVDDYELTYDQKQVLLGSLLGDGTLNSRNNLGAGFQFSQSKSRQEYFNLKTNIFKKYVSSIVHNNEKNISTVYCIYNEQFSDINNSIVWRPTSQDKKPYLSKKLVSEIDWLALAIWYFDDGNNADNSIYNNGKRIRIWSTTASPEEQENVVSVLNSKFNLNLSYYDDGNNKFFVIKNYDLFFSNIAKFATPDLAYKIPEKYHRLIGTYYYNTNQTEPYYAKIINIVEWSPPISRRGYKTKWCIDVEDNHNFLTDVGLVHNCKDGDATMQLYQKFKPLVDKNPHFVKLYNDLLKPAIIAIIHLESNGGPIDIPTLEALIDDYKIDIEETMNELAFHPAIQQFEEDTGKTFNPNSVYHLRQVLFDILKLKPIKKTETGAFSTDAEVLEELKHPITEAVLDLRKKVKLSQTYLKNIKDGLDQDARLRSSFNITGTTSGRLSSSGVLNYQNLPRDKDAGIKKVFRAKEGYSIVQADLGTAEVYVAAALSNDKFLQRAFIEKLDFHSYVAKNMFKLDCSVNEVKNLYPDLRQYSKAITFGILYGAGPNKISETANITVAEAKDFIAKYFREANNLRKWIDSCLSTIESNYFIYSAFGRKRRLPEVQSPNKGVAAHASRSGLNFLIQSVASDINIFGLVDTVNWVKNNNLQSDIKIFATVHDSIVAEVNNNLLEEYASVLKSNLQKDRGVFIPGCPIVVDVEVGPSWGELSNYVSKK
jgi:DNA polymerase I-like protein with 3'-5' exonuclease and polymerase domains